MKGKDKKALQGKTLAEIETLLREKRGQLVKVRMERALNKIKNVHTGLAIRREIAILETVKRAHKLKEENSE
jgi:ribosomal protein L29